MKDFDWTRSTGHRLAGPTADDDMPDAEEEEPVGRRLGGAAFPSDLPAPLAASLAAQGRAPPQAQRPEVVDLDSGDEEAAGTGAAAMDTDGGGPGEAEPAGPGAGQPEEEEGVPETEVPGGDTPAPLAPLAEDHPQAQEEQDPATQRLQRMQRAIASLGAGPAVKGPLQTIERIIQNLIEHPYEQKFRSINATKFASKVPPAGGKELLTCAGFTEEAAQLVLRNYDPGLLWLTLSCVRDVLAQS